MITVVIVEDKQNIREGLATLINGTDGYCCAANYSSCEALFQDNIDNMAPDVILMDIVLPGMSGIEGVKRLKEGHPNINVLILTIYEENDLVFEALCAGACGYLTKQTPPARLLEAIKEANEDGSPMSSHIARKVVNLFKQKNLFTSSSQSPLTSREKEILTKLVQGNSYQKTADSLFISINTVRYHLRNIYRKLHVHSQTEAVAKALQERLI